MENIEEFLEIGRRIVDLGYTRSEKDVLMLLVSHRHRIVTISNNQLARGSYSNSANVGLTINSLVEKGALVRVPKTNRFAINTYDIGGILNQLKIGV